MTQLNGDLLNDLLSGDPNSPANKGMLLIMRAETKSEYKALRSNIGQLDGKVDRVESKIEMVAQQVAYLTDHAQKTDRRFEAVDQRFDKLDQRLDDLTEQGERHGKMIGNLIERVDDQSVRLARVEKDLKGVHTRLDGIENRIAKEVRSQLDGIDDRIAKQIDSRLQGIDDRIAQTVLTALRQPT